MKKFLLGFIVAIGAGVVFWKVASTPSLQYRDELETSVAVKSSIVENRSLEVDQNNNREVVDEITDFQDRLDLYFKALPTMDDLKGLTADEVHHTPEIIKMGGEFIGRIHDEAENGPGKRSDALFFFKRCAEDQQIAIVIRAVCLNKVYKLVPVWKISVPLSDENISDEVSDLALKL